MLPFNRCLNCNKLLFKGRFIEVEIKCRHCKTVNHLSAAERLTSNEECNHEEKKRT
jgi:phage FluMu protein Com